MIPAVEFSVTEAELFAAIYDILNDYLEQHLNEGEAYH